MEVLNDLLNYKNLKIYQDTESFAFSLDTVLLANFVTLNKKTNNIIDLGAGNGALGLFLSTRTSKLITGIEIQENIAKMALKSIKYNNLENQIKIINDDIKNMKNIYEPSVFDVVISNPPFFKYESSSHINKSLPKIIARHEYLITLEEIIKNGAYLLNNKGYFAMVHRPERLIEIITLFQKYKIEPKRIQLIHPSQNKDANILLIEGIKCGNPGLKILNPIFSHNENGTYTEEIERIFNNER